LLEKVRTERRVGLLTIPGAPVGRAEPLHDPHHRGDRGKIGEWVQRREHEEARASGAVALRAGDGGRAIGLEERHRVRGRIPRAPDFSMTLYQVVVVSPLCCWLTFPASRVKSSFSAERSVIIPCAIQPMSPPLSFVALSSEYCFAISPKSVPASSALPTSETF